MSTGDLAGGADVLGNRRMRSGPEEKSIMEGSVREAIPVINASLATAFLDALTHAGAQLAELVERDIVGFLWISFLRSSFVPAFSSATELS